jgi:hypothetical protein
MPAFQGVMLPLSFSASAGPGAGYPSTVPDRCLPLSVPGLRWQRMVLADDSGWLKKESIVCGYCFFGDDTWGWQMDKNGAGARCLNSTV